MASIRNSVLLKGVDIFTIPKAYFSKSFSCKNMWRLMQGIEKNPNAYGPLRNLPDYSFVDGRPYLYGYKKKVQLERQKQFCKMIVELNKEMDDGLKEYQEKVKLQEMKNQEILNNKLKPKGIHLLKKR